MHHHRLSALFILRHCNCVFAPYLFLLRARTLLSVRRITAYAMRCAARAARALYHLGAHKILSFTPRLYGRNTLRFIKHAFCAVLRACVRTCTVFCCTRIYRVNDIFVLWHEQQQQRCAFAVAVYFLCRVLCLAR